MEATDRNSGPGESERRIQVSECQQTADLEGIPSERLLGTQPVEANSVSLGGKVKPGLHGWEIGFPEECGEGGVLHTGRNGSGPAARTLDHSHLFRRGETAAAGKRRRPPNCGCVE